ncbi:hypothetical protein [Flavobacterium oreochromis]|uniref:hypothetical protein n=1 Tax=Flavobacterium oreochromis TaxID=2906078 RepID=UPI00385FA563
MYILLSSLINFFLKNNLLAPRVVSLLSCILLFILIYNYFFKKLETSFIEKIILYTFFIAIIFISRHCFIGTSDFMSICLLFWALMFLIELFEKEQVAHLKKLFSIGILIGVSITVRPTVLVIYFCFAISLLFFKKYRLYIFSNLKELVFLSLISISFIVLINFYPIIKEHKIILDVKEVPKETGVNWLQRNYLMAKFWDDGTLEPGNWLSTQDVIDYKLKNPNVFIPKSNFEILVREPFMYTRQLIRMFVKANYTYFRFLYLFYPLLFLIFIPKNIFFNQVIKNDTLIAKEKYKLIILTLFSSTIVFSFLALKMFEPRWVIAILLVYILFSIEYLLTFERKKRYLLYLFSSILGVIMFSNTFLGN